MNFRGQELEIENFKNQFFAYMKYKEMTGERKHRWSGFLEDYSETDYITLLQTEKQINNNNQKNNKNEKPNYIAGRQTEQSFAENVKKWNDAFDGIDF